MDIKTPKTENDYLKINDFFWKIWKEEFDLDIFDDLEKYKKSENFFIEENEKIVSAICFFKKDWKYFIWRFATDKDFRWKWFWTKIFEKTLDFIKNLWENEVSLNAEIKQKNFYKKFGFEEIWEQKEIWNTKSILMRKIF